MMSATRTLGTALRHLIDLLDGDVEAVYMEDGLDFRPRYSPLIKGLAEHQPLSIRELASAAGITHSAASQSAAMMKRGGLVEQHRTKRCARAGDASSTRPAGEANVLCSGSADQMITRTWRDRADVESA